MSYLEQIAVVGNGRQECQAFMINAGDSVTCYFQASGSDTATAKYFDLKGTAFRVAIYSTQDAQITHINGHELKSPLPLGDGWNTWTTGIRWINITVKATTDSTTFTVLAY